MAMTEKQKIYDKNYQQKIKQYRCKYNLTDLWITDIIDKYLIDNDISYNEYSRRLVLADLIEKKLITLEELQNHGMNYPKDYTCKRVKLTDTMY